MEILNSIIVQLSKEQNLDQDCLKFLSNLNLPKMDIQFVNLFFFERQQKEKIFQKKIKIIMNLIEKIKEDDFNSINYTTEIFTETRKFLKQKITSDFKIIQFLQLLIHLTKIDKKFIQSGSNSLNLLVEMKVDLTNKCFSNIKIKNTSLIGANFVRCNLSGSQFENVDISGLNLNGALLFNCNWKKMKIYELNKLEGHNSFVRSVCFSPDGTILASCSDDKSIRLWDYKAGQQKAKLDGHSDGVKSVCFSPDGTTLASGSVNKTICLWEVKSGQQIVKLEGHIDLVNSVCFSPKSNILASGSDDKSISLWDYKTGQQKAKLDGHSDGVKSVCDGTTLASGSDDKSIRLWDIQAGQKAKIDVHTSTVFSVCFSPDGATLASGCGGVADFSIRLWNVKTMQQKAKLDGHAHFFQSVCFSPDGATLSSGSLDCIILLRDIKTEKQKAKFVSERVQSVCFSPDGSILASNSNNSISLWDVQTQQTAKQNGHTSFIESVSFSPDGTTLASGSDDKSIRLWDVMTGLQKAQFSHSEGDDKFVWLWDVKSGQQKSKFDCHHQGVKSISFSPDGIMLALAADRVCSICLFDVETGQLKAKLDGHSSQALSICFSPDGTTLASGGLDLSIRLWDAKTGSQKAKLNGHYRPVISICFSPNGALLASASMDKLFVYGMLRHNNKNHTVWSECSFTNGTILITGNDDGSICLKEGKTGQQIESSDTCYKNFLAQVKTPLFQNNPLPEIVTSNITILIISEIQNFQAQNALILQGEFVNHLEIDLKTLFQQKGSFILER